MRAMIASLALLLVAACVSGSPSSLPSLPPGSDSYRLAPNDVLQVNVFGSEDISGTYPVSDTGMVGLPLIGNVKATGLTPEEFTNEVRTKLADGYVRNPRVTVTVTVARPIYVYGEVTRPGQYPFAPHMTVANAIVVGGGFSYRASERLMTVTRDNKDYKALPTNTLMPGDIVRVPERMF